MDIRKITDNYYSAPQLDPGDFEALAAQGITTVICNRPDSEIPPSHHADAMRVAAEAAGIAFHVLPLTHQTFTPDNIARQRSLIEDAPGAVLAYCASGTRSTIAWALGQAGRRSTDEIVAAAASGGYDLANMAPTLDALAAQAQS